MATFKKNFQGLLLQCIAGALLLSACTGADVASTNTKSNLATNATMSPQQGTNEVKAQEIVPEFALTEEYLQDPTDKNQTQRVSYKRALDAIRAGEYQQAQDILQNQLQGYPLAVHIRYKLLRATNPTFSEVQDFLVTSGHKALNKYLRNQYIAVTSNSGRYTDLLSIAPEKPDNKKLQCHWYQAKYFTSNQDKQYSAPVIAMYRDGQAMPDGCNSFLAKLRAKGLVTAQDDYARLDNSYWKRKGEKTYRATAELLKKSQYASAIQTLHKMYANPDKYNDIAVDKKQTALTVFKRYARLKPLQAYPQIPALQKKYHLTLQEVRDIERVMLGSMLFEKQDVPYQYVDRLLAEFKDADLLEHRIRNAIWQKDYRTVDRFISLLPPDKQKQENYTYWRARALEALGDNTRANEFYHKIAVERCFYCYLAADKLGLPYQINDLQIKLTKTRQQLIDDNPAYARFLEFELLQESSGMRSEWFEILNTSTIDDSRMIALVESKRGYQDLAVWETIVRKDWSNLKSRFPVMYEDMYRRYGKEQQVDMSYLLGITRQESIMNPIAVSPVGARGLMQIMPDTAKSISKRNSYPYAGAQTLVNPDVNIKFGATYLRELLNTFSGNRIYATAAYNAGPNRATRWQSRDGVQRDIATYVEAIPFNETRNYVQRVIFYDYMYQYLLGVQHPVFLTDDERNANY